MSWIVWKEENGKIKLVSEGKMSGMLPKGAYLTVEDENCKFILRVDDSSQNEQFQPSPLIIEMNLSPIIADTSCQNILTAYRVKDIVPDDDDLIHFIRPLLRARRSTQDEIKLAMDANSDGPEVFVATMFANNNTILKDENKKYITAKLPYDFFFHQTMICGKTGSGKTVCMKYLSQFFSEYKDPNDEFDDYGAVLAINVKGNDLLYMHKPSETDDPQVLKEWKSLNQVAHGHKLFTVYRPSTNNNPYYKNKDICATSQKICLSAEKIEPESLTGLLQGISDLGAMSLPGIFRWWRDNEIKKHNDILFKNFVEYFSDMRDGKVFETMNEQGELSSKITLHPSTFASLERSLNRATSYFDNSDAMPINWEDILQEGKISVIDVTGTNETEFGSILLRHLLKQIVNAKNNLESRCKLLIIIDEVHQFYNTNSSKEALGDLDTICRTGRQNKIGVIFASQSPSDIPKGLSSVVNTRIFFKSDAKITSDLGIKVSADEMEGLKKGYAVASIHELPQLKVLKFPLSYGGVINE